MRLFLRLVGLLLLALPGLAVVAQTGYPEPRETHINDFASVLPADTEDRLRALLAGLKAEKNIEVVVVTIGSIKHYGTGDSTFESFATNLFNTWGIGSRQSHNGVLLLVAVDDRNVRIEVGSMYENTLNDPMRGVIDEFILPAFRAGDYAGGVVQGVRGIYYQLTGEFPAELPAPIIAQPTRTSDSGDGLMGLLIVFAVLVSVGSWLWRLVNGDTGEAGDGSDNSYWGGSSRRRSSWSSSSSWRSSSGSHSNSSSGSRHGGGRSSGGGASGSW